MSDLIDWHAYLWGYVAFVRCHGCCLFLGELPRLLEDPGCGLVETYDGPSSCSEWLMAFRVCVAYTSNPGLSEHILLHYHHGYLPTNSGPLLKPK